MSDPVIDILNALKGYRFIVYIVLFVLTINGIAEFTHSLEQIHKFATDLVARFQKRQSSDDDLKQQSLDMAKQLIDLVNTRQKVEPQVDFEDWNRSTERLIQFSRETQNIYLRDYAPTVAKLRDEFLKRALRDKELDMLYGRPTNRLGIQAVSLKLAELANKLPE